MAFPFYTPRNHLLRVNGFVRKMKNKYRIMPRSMYTSLHIADEMNTEKSNARNIYIKYSSCCQNATKRVQVEIVRVQGKTQS